MMCAAGDTFLMVVHDNLQVHHLFEPAFQFCDGVGALFHLFAKGGCVIERFFEGDGFDHRGGFGGCGKEAEGTLGN